VRVAVSGSHGFIASALLPKLRAEGHDVLRLVRGEPEGADDVQWDPMSRVIDAPRLDGIDAVVHLAGAGIGDRKWTPQRKRLILESRSVGTEVLARALAGLRRPPSVLVCSSAVGYYGNRGDLELTEQAPPGDDFLAQVCIAWEAATVPASQAGIRVVNARNGIVLGRHGGVLGRMLLPFRLGLGGRLGSGKQYMSWISLRDVVDAVVYALTTPTLAGPVNFTAPEPVTNAEFTDTLGDVLHRPTVLPTPLFPLELRFGKELVRDGLLAGQRAIPSALLASGYTFRDPELDRAMRALLTASK
jgi:uncharacterized protein (TIGR01777 family)